MSEKQNKRARRELNNMLKKLEDDFNEKAHFLRIICYDKKHIDSLIEDTHKIIKFIKDNDIKDISISLHYGEATIKENKYVAFLIVYNINFDNVDKKKFTKEFNSLRTNIIKPKLYKDPLKNRIVIAPHINDSNDFEKTHLCVDDITFLELLEDIKEGVLTKEKMMEANEFENNLNEENETEN